MISAQLDQYIQHSTTLFNTINRERKELLSDFAQYIINKKQKEEPIQLIFICTHNSRRSHLGQIWAQAAAFYFNIDNVDCYSGGTEATAFNPRAVKAIEDAGCKIQIKSSGKNPVYFVTLASKQNSLELFSKRFDDSFNPQEKFAAVMTCNDADEACPVVHGAEARFPIKYLDPKEADNTPEEENRYAERCRQISIEMLYVFALVAEGIMN